MKRKEKEFLIWFLTALFGVLIVICSAFLMTALAVTLPEEKNRGSVETQNILSEENCPEAMDGRVTIYHDGETVYQYAGPFEAKCLSGKYEITIRTEQCSCFERRNAE